jgi:hypothetical protein
MTEAAVPVDPAALIIRAPMSHCAEHADKCLSVIGAKLARESCDPAHISLFRLVD